MDENKQWEPVPAHAPEPPREPPPEFDPKKKNPEMGDQNIHDRHAATNGSVVLGGEDPRRDDRFDSKIKDDDEM